MSDQPIRRYLSYGGGTQSAALALMTASGDAPRVDAVIFADTKGELPETYEYAEYVAKHLAAARIPFLTVTAGSLEDALLSPVITSSNPTPPAHVLNPDGSHGRINQYRCSFDFKRRIIARKAKQLCGGRGAWKLAMVEQWIGFSAEELGRCKQDTECRCSHAMAGHTQGGCDRCSCPDFDRWRVNTFPLIAMGYRRSDTISWFAKHSHPTPPRSACFFCPNSTNARWQQLQATHPDLWERACRLDEHIRDGGAFNARGNKPFAGQMFLHSSRVPLRVADIRTKRQVTADSGQSELFDDAPDDCLAGVCFT